MDNGCIVSRYVSTIPALILEWKPDNAPDIMAAMEIGRAFAMSGRPACPSTYRHQVYGRVVGVTNRNHLEKVKAIKLDPPPKRREW